MAMPAIGISLRGGGTMQETRQGRRGFLKGAIAGGAAVAGATPSVQAQTAPSKSAAADTPPGYQYLRPAEAAFVEALVDHMVPSDNLSPKGTDLQINIYIDRALAGAWGRGDRLYRQGPWKNGTPSQGYHLPLTPAELMRGGKWKGWAACREVERNGDLARIASS